MRMRVLCLALALPIAACSHASQSVKAEPPAPPAPAAVVEAPPVPVQAAEPVPKACAGDDQCSTGELCLSARCVAITPNLAECRTSAHFDFDRAELHPDDLPRLRREARCLNALPSEHTLVAGSCDERGTAQYNIALGFRRSHAVAKYVEDLGVPARQLSEVSYGKELPLCTESTESCWARNRRADVSPGAEAKDVTAMVRADERREKEAASGSQTTAAARRTPHARRTTSHDQPAAAQSTAAPGK